MNAVIGWGIGVIIGLLTWISFNMMSTVFLLRNIRDLLERKP